MENGSHIIMFQLSLLCAHVCMLPTLYQCEEEDPLDCRPVTQCKVISIAIHYFFTTCFTFMFLEGRTFCHNLPQCR